MSGVIKVRNLNTHISSIGLITVSVIVLVIGFMSMPMAFGGGCSTLTFTNDANVYPRCIVVDTAPPQISKAFVTPNDYVCVETHDNTQTVKVTFNGKQVPKWEGSNGFFCTNERLPAAIRVVAEDIAGNTSEMVAINKQQVFQTEEEQIFSAERSLTLNPHHGVEGIVLSSKIPIKQIRIGISPDFSLRELYVSEYALKEFYGKREVVVDYKGQYANTEYGKERHGFIHIFATNLGHVATFEVVVKDDIIVYKHQQKQTHKPYDLDLKNVLEFDEMNMNMWQKAELEKIFSSNGELTIVQKSVLINFLR